MKKSFLAFFFCFLFFFGAYGQEENLPVLAQEPWLEAGDWWLFETYDNNHSFLTLKEIAAVSDKGYYLVQLNGTNYYEVWDPFLNKIQTVAFENNTFQVLERFFNWGGLNWPLRQGMRWETVGFAEILQNDGKFIPMVRQITAKVVGRRLVNLKKLGECTCIQMDIIGTTNGVPFEATNWYSEKARMVVLSTVKVGNLPTIHYEVVAYGRRVPSWPKQEPVWAFGGAGR